MQVVPIQGSCSPGIFVLMSDSKSILLLGAFLTQEPKVVLMSDQIVFLLSERFFDRQRGFSHSSSYKIPDKNWNSKISFHDLSEYIWPRWANSNSFVCPNHCNTSQHSNKSLLYAISSTITPLSLSLSRCSEHTYIFPHCPTLSPSLFLELWGFQKTLPPHRTLSLQPIPVVRKTSLQYYR